MLADNNFQLSHEMRRFKKMLSHFPLLLPYWDFNDGLVDLKAIHNDSDSLSPNLQIMGNFFIDVWTGSDEVFRLSDAAKTLEPQSRQIIIDWLKEPFYP